MTIWLHILLLNIMICYVPYVESICNHNTPPCGVGENHEIYRSKSIGFFGVCSTCKTDRYQDQNSHCVNNCFACKTCGVNEYETRSCTPSTNRECEPCISGSTYKSSPTLCSNCSNCNISLFSKPRYPILIMCPRKIKTYFYYLYKEIVVNQ